MRNVIGIAVVLAALAMLGCSPQPPSAPSAASSAAQASIDATPVAADVASAMDVGVRWLEASDGDLRYSLMATQMRNLTYGDSEGNAFPPGPRSWDQTSPPTVERIEIWDKTRNELGWDLVFAVRLDGADRVQPIGIRRDGEQDGQWRVHEYGGVYGQLPPF